ncbi:hypothetical protein F5Y11DRAFT_222191 [Daldinia sp. FL1419]|nr:hypothetical protein F5Y11DRAFT_222191 [Daldinia sp. FL1419]
MSDRSNYTSLNGTILRCAKSPRLDVVLVIFALVLCTIYAVYVILCCCCFFSSLFFFFCVCVALSFARLGPVQHPAFPLPFPEKMSRRPCDLPPTL